MRFKPVGEHGTEVRVKLQYDPPAGKLGAAVASMLGEDPQQQIAEDLRVFKQLLESGEAGEATAGHQIGFVGSVGRLRFVQLIPRSQARECDWTHSGLAHPRGGRPRSGERFRWRTNEKRGGAPSGRAATTCCQKMIA